ncbi:Secondary metabolism regulator LAE1 [Colletotrichum sp. SAR 10_70]|nr:Secondary metabolism regulator LAE1 [Colletotrichum sp. SAR 10_71]KAI8161581.1 Secondary metabolism regulator LAE1 [Colletotrichum sp. SAR 10_70]KAI8188555.1 Secondary metabolism regulator LAE1 [Colletotrichum sp. SAR 10_65]KAJ5006231.1 Secondary metabolism regulator LAE1 [Colletotrichum sp. SAR 10_66]
MAQSQLNPEVVLAVDENDDIRSELGSSIASSSTSLRSSLLDYRVENGRTYHRYKDGKYNLPNDERESDRMDLVHQLWLLTLDDRLGVAPPCKEGTTVGRVLDVGTGTGIWALNFGDEHPEADVYGNDLSPIMPGHNIEPGGYLELQEMDLFPRSDDGTLKADSAFLKWANFLHEASVKFGRPYVEIAQIRDLMAKVGFEDVTMSVYKWPSNSWPKDTKYKELGIWNNENVLSGLEAFSMAPFTRALEWKPAEVSVFLIDVRKDVNDRSIHAYWPM